MTFGQNPGPKMFSKSLIMLFSPWVNLGDWKMDLYRWDASIFPHLSVEEDDKGVDLLDLLLQELHQLLHSLTIALNIISKAWLDLDRKELIDLIINLDLDFGLSNAWSVNNCYRSLVVAIPPELLLVTKLHLIFTASFAHLSLPWSIDWVALSFLVRCSFRHGDIFSSSSFFFFSSSFSYFGGLRHPCHPHHPPSPLSPWKIFAEKIFFFQLASEMVKNWPNHCFSRMKVQFRGPFWDNLFLFFLLLAPTY